MCYFVTKIKNLLQFTFEKITCCAKSEKKITCRQEKSQPPLISNGPSLTENGKGKGQNGWDICPLPLLSCPLPLLFHTAI